MNAIIWISMGVAAVTSLGALGSLINKRLLMCYPMLCAMLTAAGVRSALLLWVKFSGQGYEAYAAAWARTRIILIVLHILVSMEVFVRFSRHLNRMGSFAVAVAGLFAAISAGIAYLTAVRREGWTQLHAMVFQLTREESLGCLIFLGLTIAFFSQFSFVPIRRNLQAHVHILSAFMVCLFVGHLLAESAAYWLAFACQMVVTLGPALCFACWGKMLTTDGERAGTLRNLVPSESRSAVSR